MLEKGSGNWRLRGSEKGRGLGRESLHRGIRDRGTTITTIDARITSIGVIASLIIARRTVTKVTITPVVGTKFIFDDLVLFISFYMFKTHFFFSL